MTGIKVAGGGGPSRNGPYTVSGIQLWRDQPDAPDVSGLTVGNYSLTGGFWTLISVVQTPGRAHLLHQPFRQHRDGILQEVPGWSLQKNSDLSTTTWMASTETTNNNGTNNFIIVNQPTGKRFYRLIKP